jgi:hypothetical protein
MGEGEKEGVTEGVNMTKVHCIYALNVTVISPV